MNPKLWDLCDDAVSYLPHEVRKLLTRWFATAASLFDPPPCREQNCCWQGGMMDVTVEFCDPNPQGRRITES